MFSCSTVTNFTRQNTLPLALGIALGMFGTYIVRWFKGRSTPVSSHNSPQKSASFTFHIIHLEGGGGVKVNAVTLSEFNKVATIEQLNALRKSVDWGVRTVKIWQGVFENSAHIVCAVKNRELIAYGCLIGNGRMGMITDIHVHPKHQRQGIGSLVMNDLVEYIKPREYAFIGLFGWEENKTVLKFYERFGFKPNPYGMQSSSSDLIVKAK